MNKMHPAPAHFRTCQSQPSYHGCDQYKYHGNMNVIACEKCPLTRPASNSIIHHEHYREINIMTNQSM